MKSRSLRWFGFILLMGIFAAVTEKAVFRPRAERLKNLDQQIKNEEWRTQEILSRFPDSNTLLENLEGQKLDLAHLRRKIGALDGKVLAGDELASLWQGSFTKESFALNENAQVTEENEFEPFEWKIFNLEARSDFGRLIKYLDSLESRSSLIRVLDLKMTPAEGVTDAVGVQIKIEAISSQRKKRAAHFIGNNVLPPEFEFQNLRDPFVFRRQSDVSEETKPEEFSLSEVIFHGEGRYAVINGELYKEGDSVANEMVVKEISPYEVRLIKLEGTGSSRL